MSLSLRVGAPKAACTRRSSCEIQRRTLRLGPKTRPARKMGYALRMSRAKSSAFLASIGLAESLSLR